MRTELYGTLARANLPAPTVQQLTYNLPMFYLGKNDHLTLSQRGYINAYDKNMQRDVTEDIFKPP